MENASIHQIKMYLQILSNCCLRLNDSDAPIFKVNEQIVAILRIFLNSLVLFQNTVGKRIAQTQKVNLKLNSSDISLIERFIHTNFNSIKKKKNAARFSQNVLRKSSGKTLYLNFLQIITADERIGAQPGGLRRFLKIRAQILTVFLFQRFSQKQLSLSNFS